MDPWQNIRPPPIQAPPAQKHQPPHSAQTDKRKRSPWRDQEAHLEAQKPDQTEVKRRKLIEPSDEHDVQIKRVFTLSDEECNEDLSTNEELSGEDSEISDDESDAESAYESHDASDSEYDDEENAANESDEEDGKDGSHEAEIGDDSDNEPENSDGYEADDERESNNENEESDEDAGDQESEVENEDGVEVAERDTDENDNESIDQEEVAPGTANRIKPNHNTRQKRSPHQIQEPECGWGIDADAEILRDRTMWTVEMGIDHNYDPLPVFTYWAHTTPEHWNTASYHPPPNTFLCDSCVILVILNPAISSRTRHRYWKENFTTQGSPRCARLAFGDSPLVVLYKQLPDQSHEVLCASTIYYRRKVPLGGRDVSETTMMLGRKFEKRVPAAQRFAHERFSIDLTYGQHVLSAEVAKTYLDRTENQALIIGVCLPSCVRWRDKDLAVRGEYEFVDGKLWGGHTGWFSTFLSGAVDDFYDLVCVNEELIRECWNGESENKSGTTASEEVHRQQFIPRDTDDLDDGDITGGDGGEGDTANVDSTHEALMEPISRASRTISDTPKQDGVGQSLANIRQQTTSEKIAPTSDTTREAMSEPNVVQHDAIQDMNQVQSGSETSPTHDTIGPPQALRFASADRPARSESPEGFDSTSYIYDMKGPEIDDLQEQSNTITRRIEVGHTRLNELAAQKNAIKRRMNADRTSLGDLDAQMKTTRERIEADHKSLEDVAAEWAETERKARDLYAEPVDCRPPNDSPVTRPGAELGKITHSPRD